MSDTLQITVKSVPRHEWAALKEVAGSEGMDRTQLLRAIIAKLANGELKLDLSLVAVTPSVADALADAETSAAMGIPNGFTSN